MSEVRRRSPVSAMVLGVTASSVGALPLFLVGALAVELTRDLAFGSAGLGIAVAMNRGTAAVLTPTFGRVTDRLGATRSLRLSVAIATAASLGIALTAHSLATLVVWLMLLGAASAMGLPASNRLLSNIVEPRRLGLAFGIKQSAPPLSTMLAGLSVPVIALTLGWRATYLVAAVIGVAVILLAGRQPPRPQSQTGPANGPLEHRAVIGLLAVAFGLVTAMTSAVTTFYVDASVAAGSSQRFAATILAVGAVTTVVVRILAGIVIDRRGRGHLELCAGLVVLGSVGTVMLATGSPAIMAVGVLIAMAGAWGFPGVFWVAVVRAYPHAPGKASGAVFPGALVGGTLGPSVFGIVAEQLSYTLAWAMSGGFVLLGAVTMWSGAKRLAGVGASRS